VVFAGRLGKANLADDGQGDVTDTHVAWKVVKDMPATASLLLIDDNDGV
jgi:hypothetical protein